ncbi:MAG TPA: peptidoglycan-binding protein [Geminicoccaceae bacterium]|nr:peptidoglycan-binding protein [Geminicoccaceae bacterium]
MRLLISLMVLFLTLVTVPAQGAGMVEALAAYGRGDYGVAATLLDRLARAGDAEARFLLGSQYARGEGVERDEVRAYAWLSLAASQGLRVAARVRDELAASMNWLQIEQAEALVSALVAGGTDTGGEATRATRSARDTAAAPSSSRGLSTAEITAIQRDLHRLGYRPGPADGLVGPQLRAAVTRFEADAGLPVDGEPTSELAARVHEAVKSGLIAQIQVMLDARGYPVGAADGLIGPRTQAALAAYRRDAGAEGVMGFDQLVAQLTIDASVTGECTATSNGRDKAQATEFLVTLKEGVAPPNVRVVTPEKFLAWWRRCRGDQVLAPAVP